MRVKVMALAACVLVTSGCGAGGGAAQTTADSTITAGPAAVATPTAGPGVPTPDPVPTATVPASPGAADPPAERIKTIGEFEALLTNAIYYKKRKGTPSLHVQRRKYAQYQFIVKWQVSNEAGDKIAAELAGYDAARILTFIKKANLPTYGSVLLLISARIKDRKNGGTIVAQVVRAKYTAAAVKNKDFDRRTIWSQTDDKPATVDPFFKLNRS